MMVSLLSKCAKQTMQNRRYTELYDREIPSPKHDVLGTINGMLQNYKVNGIHTLPKTYMNITDTSLLEKLVLN